MITYLFPMSRTCSTRLNYGFVRTQPMPGTCRVLNLDMKSQGIYKQWLISVRKLFDMMESWDMSNTRSGIRDYKIVILGDGGVGKSGKKFDCESVGDKKLVKQTNKQSKIQ